MFHPAGAGRGSQVEEATGEWVASWGVGDGGCRGLFVGRTGITGTQLSARVVRKQGNQISTVSKAGVFKSEKCYFQVNQCGLRSDHVTGRPLKVKESHRFNRCALQNVDSHG